MNVGIDIGGTNTRIVTSASLDEVIFDQEITISTSRHYADGVKNVTNTIKEITKNVSAIGVGLPGSINEQGILNGSTNLPDWVEKPFKQTLEKMFACDVYIKNDAEIGALGEAHYSANKNADFLYLTWGTGLGVAQIRWKNDKPQVSRPANRQSIYDLESLVGGKDIAARLGKEAEALSDEEWDLVITDFYSRLPSLVDEYGFNTFVIGGGIANRKKKLLETKAANLSGVTVHITDLEGKAGLYGALALCKVVDV